MSGYEPVTTSETTPQPRSNAVGLAALVIGAIALLLAIIPVLSFIAWPPAIAAIVLGIIGLVLRGRRRLFAWLGIVLGVLALLVGILVSIATAAGLAAAVNGAAATSSASASPSVPTTSSAPATASPTGTPTPDTTAAENAAALALAQQYAAAGYVSKAALYDRLVAADGGNVSAAAAQVAVDGAGIDYAGNAIARARELSDGDMQFEGIRAILTSEKYTQQEIDAALASLGS